MDITAKAESMGRRPCKDGDEVDYLTRSRRYFNCYHGVVSTVKTNQRRRTRRATRQALRNWDGE